MTNLAVPQAEQQTATAEVSELVVAATEQASVGMRLRLGREARGWTQAQVARRLNMTGSYIEALESDDFETLPNTTFVRGYLRNYAVCLKLSPQELIAVYQQQLSDAAGPAKMRKREKLKAVSSDPVMRVLGALSVLLFVLFSMFWWRQQGVPLIPANVNDTVAIVEVENVAGETLVETLDLSVPELVDRGASAVVGSPAVMFSAAVLAGNEVGDVLLVDFADSSWLEVRDARGSVLFSGVKQAGEILQLASLSSFDIVIGNAAAVNLSYNSAPVDLSIYTSGGNSAKLQLGL